MNDKDILLAALERASAAESMLRRLVDETENDGVIGWEERMTQCIADANKLLAGKFIDGSGACNTCNGHGMVGGHSGQTPEQYEEWQEPCPDCGPTNSATTPQSSAPGVGGVIVGDILYRIDAYALTGGLSDADFRNNAEPIFEDIRGYFQGGGYEVMKETIIRPAESVAQGGVGGELLSRICDLIRTQDNRITSHPVFVVEQQRTIYAVDTDYDTDGFDWLDDGGVVESRLAARLEKLNQAGGDTGKYRRLGYKHYWEFVTACFTEQGCKDYLAANGHNLKNPRIYVYSAYRNAEWIALREILAATPATGRGGDVSDAEVDAYVAAVNEHLGSLSPKDWEIERFDPAKSIAKVARIGLEAASKARAHPAPAGGDAGDAARLDWLESNEADLVTHRERENAAGEYSIWWNVVKHGESISGHPLGYAREAIDFAMALTAKPGAEGVK